MRVVRQKTLIFFVLLSFTIVCLLALLSATGTLAQATEADRFSFPLDPSSYSLNGGYDFLDWSPANQAYHPGEDWNRNNSTDCNDDYGDSVYAIANGAVVAAGNYPGLWGNIVLIEHRLPDGGIIWSQYAHLSRIDRWSGSVSRGDQIGAIGKGGWDCAHLHWEIRITDLAADFWPSGMSQDWIQDHYVDPTNFLTYSEIDNEVILFEDSFYRGNLERFQHSGLTNLTNRLNDQASSIAIPEGWAATLYEHSTYDSNWPGGQITFRENDTDFANDYFDNGRGVNDKVSSLWASPCDPRISRVDTAYPNGRPGPKDGNIDLFEATLYINNFRCSFGSDCDTRIPSTADGALGVARNGYLDFGEITLVINNYQCNRQD